LVFANYLQHHYLHLIEIAIATIQLCFCFCKWEFCHDQRVSSDRSSQPVVTYIMGNANVFEQRLERASKTGSLTLSDRKKEVPKEVFALVQLHTLNLSDNVLEAIPPGLSALTKLKNLSLRANRLKSIDTGIEALVRLEVLTLDNNRLTSIPSVVFKLPSLRQLTFSDNQVKELPAEIGEAKRLEVLDASRNKFHVLPAELNRLTSLRELNLQGNPCLCSNNHGLFCSFLQKIKLKGFLSNWVAYRVFE